MLPFAATILALSCSCHSPLARQKFSCVRLVGDWMRWSITATWHLPLCVAPHTGARSAHGAAPQSKARSARKASASLATYALAHEGLRAPREGMGFVNKECYPENKNAPPLGCANQSGIYARIASLMNLPLLGCCCSRSQLSRSQRKLNILCPRCPRGEYALRTRSLSSIFFVMRLCLVLMKCPCGLLVSLPC